MHLSQLGWTESFAAQFYQLNDKTMIPARVARDHGQSYVLYSELGELHAEVAGRLRHVAHSRSELPAVGDWIAATPREHEATATIHAVLGRKSSFSRKTVGSPTDEQVVAANIDTLFLVAGLDHDFNPRRLERYLARAYDSVAQPVIVLNKADLACDLDEKLDDVKLIAPGVPIHAVSAALEQGMDVLSRYATVGQTVALLGSSGVGKSTLINRLLGQDRLLTGEVRAHDGRGRHTTTSRELILLPDGGLLIDTPGMREMQLWVDESSLDTTFSDIEQLAHHCRFRDCAHATEPGCAIRSALDSGDLSPDRFENYQKLQRELRHLAIRQDQRLQSEQKQQWKKLSRLVKDNVRRKRGV